MQTPLDQYPIFKDFDNGFSFDRARKVQFHWNFVDPFKRKALQEISDAIKKFKLLGTIDC